jgi:hypothetical protein
MSSATAVTTSTSTTPLNRSGPWLSLSLLAAALAVLGNVVALADPDIYAGLTASFLPQALAQDVADLVVVVPVWLAAAWLARRGSLRARGVWVGVLVFLLWLAVLGLAAYALAGWLVGAGRGPAPVAPENHRVTTVVGWALVAVAVLFAVLWLSEDLPALVAGERPQSVVDLALPTNPVHILDLALLLPAALATGLLLRRRRPLGMLLAPPMLTFFVLTGVPILLTPVVQVLRGEAPDWSGAVAIGALVVVMLALLSWLLSSMTAIMVVVTPTRRD